MHHTDHVTRNCICILLFSVVLLAAGCAPDGKRPAPAAADQPRVETTRHNGITLAMTFTPGGVSLDRDVILSLKLTHPEGVAVTLPPLADRLQGFLAASSFDRESAPAAGGLVTRERVVRLTPLIAPEYRIAPMAVAFRSAAGDGDTAWFATAPVVLPLNAVTDKPVDETLRGELRPVPVRPSLKTLSGYAALLALAAALAALALRLAGRIRRQIRIMRMSPRERALRELEMLLARKLVESGRVKDFYVELTMIVRRYIERRHRVRAPEQTTQEFLRAVADDPRFAAHTVERLRRFLEAADMVKFAAWNPGRDAIDQATFTAREYLGAEEESAGGGPAEFRETE